MTRADDLRWLIAEMERERGMGASHANCDDEHELFDRFRALVNTREPKPAGGEFLDAAAELGCSSIAFCCISTGVFGFPQEAAAAIAIDAVRAWLDSYDSGTHVIFNVFTDRDERIYHGFLFDAAR